MLPYLEVSVIIGISETETKSVLCRLYPTTVQAYHEGYTDKQTILYLQSGSTVAVSLSLKEYEEKVRQYCDLISKLESKLLTKTNLKINK
jgi:hypothetical protein